MKIAFVIYNLSNGGAENVVALLSRHFAEENEVNVIVFEDKCDYLYGGTLINLDVPSLNGKLFKLLNICRRAYKLNELFKKEKFDRIYSFMESASIPSLLVNKNIIVSIRNNPLKFDVINQFIIKNLYKRAKKVIVNSNENKKILNNQFNLLNVEVIYNPINFDQIKLNIEEENSFDFPYIIAVGRLHYQKGFDMLLTAYSKSKLKNYAKLIVLGDGDKKNNLIELRNSLDIKDKVLFLGRKNNPHKYIKNALFFVLSSRYEGFPNVLVESLACQTPVISFNCKTGPNEIIEDNLNGFLVADGDIEELSLKMDELFNNRDKRAYFIKNSYTTVSHLDIDKISKSWLNIKE